MHVVMDLGRASHRNRKHTAIRVFYTGTCTVPFGLAVQYLTAVANTDIYRIDRFNLLPYYGIYGTIRVDLNFYFHSIRFQRKRTPTDELTKFCNLPQEDFDTCDPLRWWHGRRAQFPQLYRLVRDIFSIPGNYLYSSTPF